MALTKISRGLLNTGVSDSSDATFLTVDSSENATLAGNLTVSGNLTVTGTSTTVDTVTMNAQNAVIFEGATADNYETTLSIVDPTSSDKTQYLLNQTGYIPLLAAVTTTAITSTPAELNLLDGVSGLVQADFTKLAAVDSTAAELNIVDGGTSATSTTLADADRLVVNDNGTMVQVALTDLETYMETSLDTLSNVTTVGTIGTGVWQGTAIASGYIAADAITGAKIADDAIDSEHYTDGSIDLAHMSANSIDSDQYVDGSIDLAHMSANSIDSDQYVDGSIDTAHLADDAVTSAKLDTNIAIGGTLGVTGVSNLKSVLIDGLSNYTGLEVKGAGAARPQVKFSNVNQGLLGAIYGTEGNALVISTGTGGATAITIDSSQRVGIGNTDPGTELTVGSTSGSHELCILAGTSNNSYLYFGDSQSGAGRYAGYIGYYHGTDYMTLNTAGTERLRITSGGDVGIGATPDYRLHVQDTTASDNKNIAYFVGTAASGSSQADGGQFICVNRNSPISQANGVQGGIAFGTNNPGSGPHVRIQGNYKYTAGRDMEFLTAADNTSSPAQRMVIKGNGYVGIAETSPDYHLHVTTPNAAYGLKIESSTGWQVQGSLNGSYFHTDGDQTFYWANRCESSGGFHTYSDENLKEEITTITGALDSVMTMNGITFKWKDPANRGGGNTGKQFGVTAQNMLEVDAELPSLNVDPLAEAGNEETDDKFYTMDYTRLTPYFIEAIKELKIELDAAKTRITELEAKLDATGSYSDLEQRIHDIEQRLV